jgi:hypothetical protein
MNASLTTSIAAGCIGVLSVFFLFIAVIGGLRCANPPYELAALFATTLIRCHGDRLARQQAAGSHASCRFH